MSCPRLVPWVSRISRLSCPGSCPCLVLWVCRPILLSKATDTFVLCLGTFDSPRCFHSSYVCGPAMFHIHEAAPTLSCGYAPFYVSNSHRQPLFCFVNLFILSPRCFHGIYIMYVVDQLRFMPTRLPQLCAADTPPSNNHGCMVP